MYTIHYILFATTTRYWYNLGLEIHDINLTTRHQLSYTHAHTELQRSAPQVVNELKCHRLIEQMNSHPMRCHLFDTVLFECKSNNVSI